MKNLVLSALFFIPLYSTAQDNKLTLEGTGETETIVLNGGGSNGGIIEIKNGNDNPQIHLFGDGNGSFGGAQFDYGQIRLDGFSDADFMEDGEFQPMLNLVNENGFDDFSIGLIERTVGDDIIRTQLAIAFENLIVARISQSGIYSQVSDERLKRNIKDFGTVLPRLKEVRTVSYSTLNSPKEEYGFLAQDLKESFPTLVDAIKSDTQETHMVNYNGMIPVLVKAVQEQQAMIDDLKTELSALKNPKKRERRSRR